MRERVEKIFRDILHDASLVLTDDSTPDTVNGWDSLSHISLIISIEDEFNIGFTMNDISKMTNFGNILKTIERRINVESISE